MQPILDPSRYTSDREPARRLACIAGGIMQKLAHTPIVFEGCMANAQRAADCYAADDEKLNIHLKDMFENAIWFANCDGAENLERGILVVRQMLISGRIELFAGKLAAP